MSNSRLFKTTVLTLLVIMQLHSKHASGQITSSKTASQTVWNGTAIWNGIRFGNAYDNAVTNCTLGRANTQYASFASYLTNVKWDAPNSTVLATDVARYDHGATSSYPYRYEGWQTAVTANARYLRFWHGSKKMTATACDANALCRETVTVALSGPDAFGKSLEPAFLGQKRVFIMLRGIDMTYGSALTNVKKFRDAQFSVDTPAPVISADGKISFQLSTNFNGNETVPYQAIVHYTVGVYDTAKVSVSQIAVSPTAFSCGAGRKCSAQIPASLPMVASSGSFLTGNSLPLFVGFRGWGFNHAEAAQINRIGAGVTLASWDAAQKKAVLKVEGEAARLDCAAVGDDSKHWLPNKTALTVVACASPDVCRALSGSYSGQEAAWTRKTWESVKKIVTETFQNAEELISHVAQRTKDNIANLVSSLFSPAAKTFPPGDVLVVLKEGQGAPVLSASSTDAVIRAVFANYGTPTVQKAYPNFLTQADADFLVEEEIFKPYDARWKLRVVGFEGNLDVPPLHRFYFLRYSGIDGAKRDAIIGELSKSPALQSVTQNYVAKLEQKPGAPYYAKNLLWFKPFAKIWWGADGLLTDLLLLSFKTETLAKGMALLRSPVDMKTFQSDVHAFDPDLSGTHFQFPGMPPLRKNACADFYASGGKKLSSLTSAPRCKAGEIVVAYEAGTTSQKRLAVEAALGLVSKPRSARFKAPDMKLVYHYALPSGLSISQALGSLQGMDGVFYAHPVSSGRLAATPNDPMFADARNWSFAHIGLPEAWEVTSGSTNVVVGVVDTPINPLNDDFYDVPLAQSGLSILWDRCGSCFYSGVGDSATVAAFEQQVDSLLAGSNFLFDKYKSPDGTWVKWHPGSIPHYDWDTGKDKGHGTHVAGIIGAYGNNGKGLSGASWRVKMYSVNTFLYNFATGQLEIQDGFFELHSIQSAIEKGSKIVNMSYVQMQPFEEVRRLIRDNPQVLFVAAAGNFNLDTDDFPFYPTTYSDDVGQRFPNLISVIASDENDAIAYWGGTIQPGSNYGKMTTDLAAPGKGLLVMDLKTDQYREGVNGSSFAAPHVSGVAALMLSYCPGLTPAQIKDILHKTVHRGAGYLEEATLSGGRLDAKAALEYLKERAIFTANPQDAGTAGTDTLYCQVSEPQTEKTCEEKAQDCASQAWAGTHTFETCAASGGVWSEGNANDPLAQPSCLCTTCDDTCPEGKACQEGFVGGGYTQNACESSGGKWTSTSMGNGCDCQCGSASSFDTYDFYSCSLRASGKFPESSARGRLALEMTFIATLWVIWAAARIAATGGK